MNETSNTSVNDLSPDQVPGNLFANLFEGTSLANANREFNRILNTFKIVPFWASSQGQFSVSRTGGTTHWGTMGVPRKNGPWNRTVSGYEFDMEVGLPIDRPVLILLIQDEPSAYLAGTILQTMVDAETTERYRRRRQNFIAEFRKQCKVPGVQVSSNGAYIGRAEYNYVGKTTEEVADWLRSAIEGIYTAVEMTICEVAERERFFEEHQADIAEPFLVSAKAPIDVGSGSERTVAEEELPFPKS